MNQQSPSASTVEFFNTIRQKRPFLGRRLGGVDGVTPADNDRQN